MAAEKKCCVPTCGSDIQILHKFPNPEKDIDRFSTWRSNIGGEILSLDNTYIFKYRRVCHLHFEPIYHTRSKMLSANAIPTLHLSGLSLELADVQESTLSDLEDISPSSTPLHLLCSKANGTLPPGETPLNDEILILLNKAAKSSSLRKYINKHVSYRWTEILSKGLQKEVKEKLLTEYIVPANCKLYTAPILNPEMKAALTEMSIERDNSLMDNQKLLGVALNALSQALNIMVSNNIVGTEILKPITDACRILCHCHYSETKLRRNFVIPAINSKLKGALNESSHDRYLFGENLSERLKDVKYVEPEVSKQYFNISKYISIIQCGDSDNTNWRDRGHRLLQRNVGGTRGVTPPLPASNSRRVHLDQRISQRNGVNSTRVIPSVKSLRWYRLKSPAPIRLTKRRK